MVGENGGVGLPGGVEHLTVRVDEFSAVVLDTTMRVGSSKIFGYVK